MAEGRGCSCLGRRVLLRAGSRCDSSSLPRESVLLFGVRLDGLGDKALVDFEVFGVDLVVVRLLNRRSGLGIKVCVVFVIFVVVVVATLCVLRGLAGAKERRGERKEGDGKKMRERTS